jgi:hypothetical protein
LGGNVVAQVAVVMVLVMEANIRLLVKKVVMME